MATSRVGARWLFADGAADRCITNNRRDFRREIAEVEVTYPDDLPDPGAEAVTNPAQPRSTAVRGVIGRSSPCAVTGVPGATALPMGWMLASLTLPESVRLERTTPTFTAQTVPPGLLRGHKVASGTWGRLRVDEGSVTFVLEETGEERRLGPGDTQVIEPDVVHHVVVDPGASFAVEFHR